MRFFGKTRPGPRWLIYPIAGSNIMWIEIFLSKIDWTRRVKCIVLSRLSIWKSNPTRHNLTLNSTSIPGDSIILPVKYNMLDRTICSSVNWFTPGFRAVIFYWLKNVQSSTQCPKLKLNFPTISPQYKTARRLSHPEKLDEIVQELLLNLEVG